jgi:ATP-dependent DNA ligase
VNNRLEVRRVDVQETKVRDRAPVAPLPYEAVLQFPAKLQRELPASLLRFRCADSFCRDLRAEPLDIRRQLLEERVLPLLSDPIRSTPALEGSLSELIEAVRGLGLDGLVAKGRDSRYEAGARSGAWGKMRVNDGQEFVIGGYTVGGRTFDALVFGYYDGPRLLYAARTRNGFTPALRESLCGVFVGWNRMPVRSRTFRRREAADGDRASRPRK